MSINDDTAAVDREALVKAGTDLAVEHLGYADMSVRVLVERITDAALAARGDAAAPTEVEWGVRYIDPQGEVHDSLRHDEVAARLSVEVDPSVTLVQRDVHRVRVARGRGW